MTHLAWIHPLLIRPGDRMSLEEFLERWEQMPDLKQAELIDGTVYMPSVVSRTHAHHESTIQALGCLYSVKTPGVESGRNGTWLMTSTSAAQPDLSILILPELGGHSTEKGGLACGAPEFVAEICHSIRAYDMGPKLPLYERAGVDEFLAVLVEERRFEWRILIDGSYELMKDDGGVYRSRILPGLWIDSTAFWSGDSSAWMHSLEQGLASQEHADFVARLARAREAATTQTRRRL